ncbi:hypothetical protein [Rhizobium sp. Nf11,1]|uniref:hypothetical protein n=1 Tax=Rhizobium sp. Nf11,1 TaxID=3404923 RepID=UPI003D34209D
MPPEQWEAIIARQIARIERAVDRIEAKLDRVLAQGRRLEDVIQPSPEADDDFALGNLIELPVAARRFETAKDTLRKWCREEGCGVKRGSRWLVSVPRVRARLGRK